MAEHLSGEPGQQTDRASAASKPPFRFTGAFNYSLDAKGRLVIPQKFREKLGDTFYIAPTHDFRGIAICSNEQWEHRCDSYESLAEMDPVANEYREWFYRMSYGEQSCDPQGRVLLPTAIRTAFLGEEKDVAITGANQYVRIVSAAADQTAWADFQSGLPGMLKTIAELEAAKRNREGRGIE